MQNLCAHFEPQSSAINCTFVTRGIGYDFIICLSLLIDGTTVGGVSNNCPEGLILALSGHRKANAGLVTTPSLTTKGAAGVGYVFGDRFRN